MRSTFAWLLLAFLASRTVEQIQATILHQPAAPSESRGRETFVDTTDPNGQHSPTQRVVEERKLSSRRFLILTDGNLIKLYPSASLTNNTEASGGQSEAAGLKLSKSFWLIKPSEPAESRELLVARFGNNSLSRWLAERSNGRGRASRAPILPTRSGADEEDYSGQSGWRKPWIVDVDYFFAREFCDRRKQGQPLEASNCLVIVWLDKSNKLVRFGSLDLLANPIELPVKLDEASRKRSRLLKLHEFAPINVQRSVANKKIEHQVHAIVVDKQRIRLFVVYSDGQSYPNRILSTRLRPDRTPDEPNRSSDETIIAFNECHGRQIDPTETSFENLSLDEESGDWLYYFDKFKGGKIFVISVNRQFGPSLYNSSSSVQALVRDIPLGGWQWPLVGGAKFKGSSTRAIGMAMDHEKRKLYWLDETRALYSCDLAGHDSRFIGQLSSRPEIQSPNSMHVFHNTLYISDSAKKSLVAYKIFEHEGSLNVAEHDSNLAQSSPTHQVLLVEMPSLYGFRLVDMDSVLTLHDAGTSRRRLQGEPMSFERDAEQTWFGRLQSNVAKLFNHGDKDEYDYLREKILTSTPCGYDQSGGSRQDQCPSDEILPLLLKLIILYLALTFWFMFMFPWLRRKVNRTGIGDAKQAIKCLV